MSIKSKGRKLGRQVRKETGLPFPIAMRAGKLLARNRMWELSQHETFQSIPFDCGLECCGPSHYAIVGPKGQYRI